MQVVIPEDEISRFSKQLSTDSYHREERDYKVAVHLVLRALLSEEKSTRDDFPQLIANVFKEAIPDLQALGIRKEDRDFIKSAVAPLGAGAVRAAMANLSGGKWGLAQFLWLPRAIDFDLGPQVASAFRSLVDPTAPLPQRVEGFRDKLDVVALALERKGGFLPNWQHFRVSMSFVAMVLTGYDPNRYTFYSKGALRHGYERYAPSVPWPTGTMGDIYGDVCTFVQEVADVLRQHGANVQDLIDAQSFIWLSFLRAKQEAEEQVEAAGQKVPKLEMAGPRIDLDAVIQDLADRCYWPVDRARRLITLVERSGQLLFQGPPGTGKTFIAETLARLLASDEEGRVEVVQFHPSYAYEDFIQGIRPVVTEGSTLAYEVRSGNFLRLAERAKEFHNDRFFLLVDEINRANLPRVFGELLYALEYRGPEHTFRLPYSGAESYIPDNITLIATMNTADRSIALVDAAIRRRFRHVGFVPDPQVLKSWLHAHKLGDFAEYAAARLVALNIELASLLDSDRLVGHSYLMRDDLGDVGLHTVWEEDIEPLLREHLFNQPEEIGKLREIFLLPQ